MSNQAMYTMGICVLLVIIWKLMKYIYRRAHGHILKFKIFLFMINYVGPFCESMCDLYYDVLAEIKFVCESDNWQINSPERLLNSLVVEEYGEMYIFLYPQVHIYSL